MISDDESGIDDDDIQDADDTDAIMDSSLGDGAVYASVDDTDAIVVMDCSSFGGDAGDGVGGAAVDGVINTSIPTGVSRKPSTFKIVGDNVDKVVKRSFERISSPSAEMHYFHCYAVLDRIDLSGMSDSASFGSCCIPELLPTSEDIVTIKHHFSTLISRYDNF